MARERINRVFLLVDWDNVTKSYDIDSTGVPAGKFAEKVILRLQQDVSSCLSRDGANRFHDVRMRFYDGWSTTEGDTQRGEVFRSVLLANNNHRIGRRVGRVNFLSNYELGDHLYGCSEAGRLHGTHRAQGQKMVDTALVCDALTLATQRVADLVVIASDDDDFIPAAISSYFLGARTLLFRSDTERVKNVLRGPVVNEIILRKNRDDL